MWKKYASLGQMIPKLPRVRFSASYRRMIVFLTGMMLSTAVWGQSFTLLTWNIQDLGRSKNEQEIAVIVNVLRNYDLVAIQEVVAKDPAGAQTVAKIADELNRRGARWDYLISDPTQSPSPYISERYAILWKTRNLMRLGDPFLDRQLAEVCHREPYIARFRHTPTRTEFFVVNVHARRFDEAPEEELRFFSGYPGRLGQARIFLMGDYNLDDTHPVWQPLKQQGFLPAISQSPTTLKRSCNEAGEYLNYAIDNIFYPERYFQLVRAGKVDLVRDCSRLGEVRKVSDHLPVFLEVRPVND